MNSVRIKPHEQQRWRQRQLDAVPAGHLELLGILCVQRGVELTDLVGGHAAAAANHVRSPIAHC